MNKLLSVIVVLIVVSMLFASDPKNSSPVSKPRYAPDLVKIKLSPDAIQRTQLPIAMYAEARSFNLNELDQLMTLNGGMKIIRAHRIVKDTAWQSRTGFDRWFLLKLDGTTTVEDAIKSFKNNRFVEEAIPEYYAYTTAVPNDTYYANNWGHNNTAQLPVFSGSSHSGAGVGTVGFDVDAQLAWDHSQGYGSASTVIAIIDSGVDTAHPDLRLVTGYDYGDNDSNPMDDAGGGENSPQGHGTSCSGVAAGRANNSLGITGIAGGCSVMPLKVANSAGEMLFTAIENAITHAADYNAHIISMSLGAESGMAEGSSPSTDATLEYAYNSGVVIFAATANSNTSTIAYPSNHNKVISVGAASPTGQRKSATSSDGEYWWGSNYGVATPDSPNAVDIMAPTILPSTDITGTTGYSTTNYYMWFNGTSCATPYAAGVAALLISKAPSLTPAQVRTAMVSTTTDMTIDGGAGWDRYTGYGMINANAALTSLVPGMPACTITAPAGGSVHNLNSTITVNVTATDTDGTITSVAFYVDDVYKSTDNTSPYSWNWNTTGYSSGAHTIKAIATDNGSNTAQSSVSVTLVAPPDEGFETGNFSAFAWANGSAVPWTVQSAEKFSGTYAAKSGAIGNNAFTTLSITLNVTSASNISFYQKVSSEAGYDFLKFYIDSVEQGSWSGAGSWALQSYAVTTGAHTFAWTYSKDTYAVDGSDCAWIDHIAFPPNAVYYAPPQNLAAAPGNGLVYLTWSAPSAGTPTGYKIYKNSAYLTTIAGLSYTDNAVVNGTTYSYYLKAVYSTGESDQTATVTATPNNISEAIIGSGTGSTGTSTASPINVYYESLHGQAVYTAAQLNAAGIYGPINIVQLGFNITALPTKTMPNFVVRLKHTTAVDVTNWINAAGMQTVYANASYIPTVTGYNMYTLSTPFLWDGTQNLVVDTAFGDIGSWTQTGTVQYTNVTNGYRYVRNDDSDQTNVFTGGSTSVYRPNLKLVAAPVLTNPHIIVNPQTLSFGAVEVGDTSVLQFTIQNTGDLELNGNITAPTGYSVELAPRQKEITNFSKKTSKTNRNTLNYSVPGGQTTTFNLRFAPTAVVNYPGPMVITSNDSANPTINVSVSGSGYIPPTIAIDNNLVSHSLYINEQGTASFTISNNGSQPLSYSLVESPAVTWFSAAPASGTIAGSGTQLITVSYDASGLNHDAYQNTLLINSNDPDTPQLSVTVGLTVLNTPPTILLPDSFSFDMNGTLVADFSSYVNDVDADPLTLSYSGNTNVLVSIDGMSVTFNATEDWFGSEELTFAVNDGTDETSDNVMVTVNFVNTPPTIALPDSFSFDMNGSLVADFSSYVNDVDADPLTLSYSGNTNVLVSIDGMSVTFNATADWFGSENITFTVSDGIDETSDEVEVAVNFVVTYLDTPQVQISESAGSITVEWGLVPYADAYQVYRSNDPLATYELVTTTSALQWVDTAPQNRAFYYVKAIFTGNAK